VIPPAMVCSERYTMIADVKRFSGKISVTRDALHHLLTAPDLLRGFQITDFQALFFLVLATLVVFALVTISTVNRNEHFVRLNSTNHCLSRHLKTKATHGNEK
jgi:hypothetical protein